MEQINSYCFAVLSGILSLLVACLGKSSVSLQLQGTHLFSTEASLCPLFLFKLSASCLHAEFSWKYVDAFLQFCPADMPKISYLLGQSLVTRSFEFSCIRNIFQAIIGTQCKSVCLAEILSCLLQDPKENKETTKEEEPSKSSGASTATKTEEEKKIKAPKKQKLVHEITMELDVNDVPDLLEDELKSSMKKYVLNSSAWLKL